MDFQREGERIKNSCSEFIAGGDFDTSERGGALTRHLRQHVRPQQFQAWSKSEATRLR